jgi:hypothetical protein
MAMVETDILLVDDDEDIPFEELPIGTLMIEAILDHEYSEGK